MIRPLRITIATLGVFFGMLVGSGHALAANSTCGKHAAPITHWSIQADYVGGTWDFQCGGANNESYQVELSLQWNSPSGWVVPICDNGGLCISLKPSSGWFAGGFETQGDWLFNVNSVQVDCKMWRMHSRVIFHGTSPDIIYNSATVQTGGC